MQSFLDAVHCRAEIRRLLEDGASVRAAVAYWGADAAQELGITTESNLSVVCDVRGGGSNPDEVKELIRLLGVERVLTHDRLHAKTWVTDNKAIVGSSNASANGLGKEGREVEPLVESNLLTDDQNLILGVNLWFDKVVLPGARTITIDDFKVGAKRHKRRRDGRPVPECGDLLTLLRKEPESFVDRNFVVWVWDPSPAADWASVELKIVQEERQDKRITFYQDVPSPPPGAYILDFGATAKKGKLVGLYKVLTDRPVHRAKDGSGSLLLCRKVKAFEGLTLGDPAMWRDAAKQAALSGADSWQIVEFAQLFLTQHS